MLNIEGENLKTSYHCKGAKALVAIYPKEDYGLLRRGTPRNDICVVEA